MNGNGSAMPARPRFAPLFAATGILGKDLVRYLPVQVTVTVLGVVACHTWPHLSRLLHGYASANVPGTYAGRLAGIVVAVALATGLAASTEEEDTRSRQFLETLPCHKGSMMSAKVAGAMLHTLFGGLLTVLLLWMSVGNLQWLTSAFSGGHLWRLGTVPFDGLSVILLAVACMLTAFVGGTLAGSVVPAAILTLLLCGAGMMAVSCVPGLEEPYVMWACFGAWGLVAAAGYPYAWQLSRDRPSSEGQWHWLWLFEAAGRPLARARRAPRIAPHLLAPAAGGVVVMASAVALVRFVTNAMAGSLELLLLLLCGPMIGVMAWTPSERERARGLVHALPARRGAFYAARMRGVIFFALLAGIAGVMLMPSARRDIVYGLLFVAATLLGAVTAAVLMLFVRMKLATMLLTMIVMMAWGIASSVLLRAHHDHVSTFIERTGWPAVAVLALTWLVGYVAYARSNLLEQSEGRRALVLLVVYPWLLAWGSALMVLAPAHLIEYLSF